VNWYKKHIEIKAQIEKLKDELVDTEREIYKDNMAELKGKIGTVNILRDDFKCKIVITEKFKVNQTIARGIESLALKEKVKTEIILDKAIYKALPDFDREKLKECLEISTGKPSFTIDELVNKKPQ